MDIEVQNNPYQESGTASGSNYIRSLEVSPMIRLLARYIDYMLFIILISIVVAAMDIEAFYKMFNSLNLVPVTFFWALIEAVLLATWGTTPGKWFFKTTVRDSAGNKLSLRSALYRSLSVWIVGMGLGIVVISFITQLVSVSSLKFSSTTRWDEKGDFYVIHQKAGDQRTAVAIVILVFFSVAMLTAYGNNDDKTYDPLALYSSTVEETSTRLFNQGKYQQLIQYLDKNMDGDNVSSLLLNQKGYAYMELGEYKRGKQCFLLGLGRKNALPMKNTFLNNLSWACYSLEQYEEALKYSEEGLKIAENSAIEYTNYGNALDALGNRSEAEEAYDKAISIDSKDSAGYYGKGNIRFGEGDYEKAIELFEKYIKLENNDTDALCYLGLSYLYGKKDTDKAKEYLDKAYKISPKENDVLISMIKYYYYIGNTREAEKLYLKALEERPEDYQLLLNIADFYYSESKYDEAIKYVDKAIKMIPGNYEAYKLKAEIYYWQGEEQKAVETVELMIEKSPQASEVYNAAGRLYSDMYEYNKAIEMFDKAIEVNPLNEDAHINKIYSLYNSKHYSECLEFSLEAEKGFDSYLVPWYIGSVYSNLTNSNKALEYYNKALEKAPDDTALLTDIGWEYYKEQDFNKAISFADKALKIDDKYANATGLKSAAQKRLSNLGEQISEFIERNYMYYKPNAEFDAVRKELSNKEQVEVQDIVRLFKPAYNKDDMFSFILHGDYYKEYLDMIQGETVEHSQKQKDVHYIKINEFTPGTANEFLDCIKGIEKPDDKYLVIDVRNNHGGDTMSGCDILDFLLPDCVVCNLIYKDGYSNPYYSDSSQIRFKHIFVLVNEESASCAELVTLGLKTYLDNVTVIGRRTYGKGVGQIGFEDKSKGFVLFIVNHYWNVRETNIMDKGIEPDVKVNSKSLDTYMDVVYRLIGQS